MAEDGRAREFHVQIAHLEQGSHEFMLAGCVSGLPGFGGILRAYLPEHLAQHPEP